MKTLSVSNATKMARSSLSRPSVALPRSRSLWYFFNSSRPSPWPNGLKHQHDMNAVHESHLSGGRILLTLHCFCCSCPMAILPIPFESSIAEFFQMVSHHTLFRRSVKVRITAKLLKIFKKVQKTLIFSLPCTVFATVLRFYFYKLQRKVLILLIL